MRNKVIGSFLIVISLACVAILVVGTLGKDKNPPEISFLEDSELHYKEGESHDRLLEDVTAYDAEDGEVTDSLVIESVYDFNNGQAKVVYVARDQSGNVAKAERMVSYEKTQETTGSAISADNAVDAFSGSSEGKTTAATKKTEATTALTANGEKPALSLTTDKVTIKKGDKSFNKLSYVDEIADDKDDRTTLFRRIMVKGQFDVNKAGTYQLEYRVTDSDGNVSDTKILTLTVEDTP